MADDLRTLLEGLGNTADEVADFLQGQGCRGFRKYTYACPIAVYLKRVTGYIVAVHDNGYVVWSPKTRGSTIHRVDIPAIANFIRAFDAGKYPDLDARKT